MTEDKLYFGINGMLKTDLCHHGVKGQKWGVRRYQNPDGTLTPEGKKRYAQLRKANNVELGHRITKGRYYAKNIGKTAGLYAASLATLGFSGVAVGSKMLQKEILKKMRVTKEFKQKHDGPVKTLGELRHKQSAATASQDMKEVNPRGLVGTRGTYKNCAYCSLALDMRRRGYDVRARVSGKGMTNSEILDQYDNAKLQKVKYSSEKVWSSSGNGPTGKALKEIGDKIESQGANARGIVTIKYAKQNSGHAMYFENDSDGKLTIYDGQSKKKDPVEVFAFCDPNSVAILRTDNLKPKESICERVTDWTKSDRKEAEKNANS